MYLFSLIIVVICSRGHGNIFDGGDWDDLADALSAEAALHGPFQNNFNQYYPCYDLGSDAYEISRGNDGLCMHNHACSKGFCSEVENYELPSYTVEAKTESDVSNAFLFASAQGMPVSVKSTGHSYQGSSTQAGSLMIWMKNYEKDLSFHNDYSNSCVLDSPDALSHDVIAIGAGSVWDDVIEAVKDDYHIVTGGGRTVSAIGGWLQGGGLSFSSRKYGIGVDQVIDFSVVLANGTAITVDACSHPELFFALRGGGGGTFGVVTKAHYKIYPVTPITKIEYYLFLNDGWMNTYFAVIDHFASWFDFWIKKSPDLGNNWCGGFWSSWSLHLLYCGTESEMLADSFYHELKEWHENLDKSKQTPGIYDSFIVDPVTFPSWYSYRGGAEAYQNPDVTDATGLSYVGVELMSSRLMPESVVRTSPEDVLTLFMNILGGFGSVNYFLGGEINNVPIEETAVNPALRSSIWSVFTTNGGTGQSVREFIPNDITGVCYNHHYVLEPDWRHASWGAHYDTLNDLKDIYDPERILNCWHCVGYNGQEQESSFEPVVEWWSPPVSNPITDPVTTSSFLSTKPTNAARIFVLTSLVFVMK